VIRVLVVDDQELVRDGFALILGAESDMDVVGRVADGVAAVELARKLRPDVALMDVRMPKMDGITATERILAALPSCRVLVLTTYDVDDYVLAALRAGATGYLLKTTPRRALVAAVRAAAEGDVLLNPAVARRLATMGARRTTVSPAAKQVLDRLTPRELEVLKAVARGNSNAEIAKVMFVAETTIKTHIGRLLQKLAARDRVQLTVLAHRFGLVEPPSQDR
jgi:DNA-binding NarL/FixJ family response regulator